MNEKALVNRAKLIEKAFELSLSKVPRHFGQTIRLIFGPIK